MRKIQKLKLNRETLRHLDGETLGRAQGGATAEIACISISRCQACPVTYLAGCVYTLQPECETVECPPGG